MMIMIFLILSLKKKFYRLAVTPEPTCQGNQFRCESGQCIHYEMVCNKQFDCNDESDEQRCSKCCGRSCS